MLTLYCNLECCWKSYIACLFCCKKKERKRCSEYQKNLEKIMSEPIPEKYEKYGVPDYCVPKEPKKRKVKPVKVSKKKEVIPTKRIVRSIPVEKDTIDAFKHTKRKRRTKAQVEADKSVAKSEKVETSTITTKKKRVRRTKAEMELARSQPQGDLKCAAKTKRIGKQSQSLEPPVCTAPSVEKESTRKRAVRSDKGKSRAKKKVVDKV